MDSIKHRRPAIIGNLRGGIGRLFELVQKIGFAGAIVYATKVRALAALQPLGWDLKGKRILLRTKDARYPLNARYSTSDLEGFEQIFVHKEYSPLDNIRDPTTIIDCGAYVGYSTVYFLNRFPNARVVAVEPDRENFLFSKSNLAPYEDRVLLLHSAIWSRSAGLTVIRGKYRDGQEWANQVRECCSGETPEVEATDLLSLMDKAGFDEVDLLKIDIEGAERVVFTGVCGKWLDRVRNIAIELHDNECKSAFFSALAGYRYDLYRSGELTVCLNLARKTVHQVEGVTKEHPMDKKISVVIPFFQQQAGLLRKAVLSALKQRGTHHLEIVIVDDESPVSPQGEVSDLLSQCPDRFKIIRRKNGGCFPANNTALEHVGADTDFVACLDSDDEWEDCHLEHAVWALERGYDLFFSDFYQLNQNITAFNRAHRINVAKHGRIHPLEPIHEYQGDMVDQIITGNIIGTSTVVYNYKKFRELRYLENFKHTGPEYIFWIALAAGSEKIAFSSIPECRYGGGVNIFSESGWGTDKFLSVRHEEIRWRMHLLRTFPLSDSQKASVLAKIQQSRLGFAKGLLHNLLHNGKVSANLLARHAKLDPKTFSLLPALPVRLVYEKLSNSLSRTTT